MEMLGQFYDTYRILINLVAITVIAATLIKIFWQDIRFFVKRLSYGLPFFGAAKRLAKDPQYDYSTGWFDGETELARDFATDYEKQDVDGSYYDKCKSYLGSMSEVGRRNLPFWGVLILFIIMVLEGFGFAFILSDYSIPGASVQIQTYGAWGISFLIATVLIWVTHSAGHQLYTNSVIKKIRAWYNLKGENRDLFPDTNVHLETNGLDADQPNWQKLLNRVKSNSVDVKPSYLMIGIAVLLILVVSVGATYVRNATLETELLAQHQVAAETSESTNVSNDPFANVPSDIPAEVLASQRQYIMNLETQKEEKQRSGGQMTFAILATVFVFIQLLGIWVGYAYGFAGRESNLAYKTIKGFKTRSDYEAYHKRKKDLIARYAQKYLKKLQNNSIKWAKNNNIEKGNIERLTDTKDRTFLHFIHREHMENLQHERNKKTLSDAYERSNEEDAREHEKLKASNRQPMANQSTLNLSDEEKIRLVILGEQFGLSSEEVFLKKQKADELGVGIKKYLEISKEVISDA